MGSEHPISRLRTGGGTAETFRGVGTIAVSNSTGFPSQDSAICRLDRRCQFRNPCRRRSTCDEFGRNRPFCRHSGRIHIRSDWRKGFPTLVRDNARRATAVSVRFRGVADKVSPENDGPTHPSVELRVSTFLWHRWVGDARVRTPVPKLITAAAAPNCERGESDQTMQRVEVGVALRSDHVRSGRW